MRFCTSRPLITITTSTRFSDSGRNSIWLSDWCGWRGIVTTPARCVSDDSICEATATSALGSRSSSCSSRWFSSLQHLRVVRALPLAQQRVDEEAITLVGRHATGRGVRRGDEAVLLEVRHDVADRGGAQIEPRITGEVARTDGLAFADVALDQHPQQVLGAFGQGIVGCFTHGHGKPSVDFFGKSSNAFAP